MTTQGGSVGCFPLTTGPWIPREPMGPPINPKAGDLFLLTDESPLLCKTLSLVSRCNTASCACCCTAPGVGGWAALAPGICAAATLLMLAAMASGVGGWAALAPEVCGLCCLGGQLFRSKVGSRRLGRSGSSPRAGRGTLGRWPVPAGTRSDSRPY